MTEEAAFLTARERLAAQLLAALQGQGFSQVDPPVIQPVDVFLNRSGENIRSRMFTCTDPAGNELCLRPDLTIPVCRAYLGAVPQADQPARLAYDGVAFRAHADGVSPPQIRQVGVEILNAPDPDATDIEVLRIASDACRAGGIAEAQLTLGDLGLFRAFVDALDIPEAWRSRLKRKFWRPAYFKALLDRLSQGQAESVARPSRTGLLTALDRLSPEEARAMVADVLKLAGIKPVGGRSISEITDRFLEQAADNASDTLPPAAADLMQRFLTISAPPGTAMAQIAQLVRSARLDLSGPLDRLALFFERLEQAGVPLENVTMSTIFGRSLEYYTGMVFELTVKAEAGPLQLAGGGRYDRLLQQLGAPRPVPAAGCAIRPEAILKAKALAGATGGAA